MTYLTLFCNMATAWNFDSGEFILCSNKPVICRITAFVSSLISLTALCKTLDRLEIDIESVWIERSMGVFVGCSRLEISPQLKPYQIYSFRLSVFHRLCLLLFLQSTYYIIHFCVGIMLDWLGSLGQGFHSTSTLKYYWHCVCVRSYLLVQTEINTRESRDRLTLKLD